ncbi:MAG: 2-amino-4-oxopentanoate thiolase subunit OrtA [Acholeplasmataceae bacterium]|nr:2-amino-4-oxopentanoate thiolase subunit OrtA [Acholeplasmataceae bacterium]
MVEKMTFVQIYKSVLSRSERATNLPADTKQVPLEMRIKGKLLNSAQIGDTVQIITTTKRIETGILIAVEPSFTHDFGHFVQTIEDIKEIILSETEDLI